MKLAVQPDNNSEGVARLRATFDGMLTDLGLPAQRSSAASTCIRRWTSRPPPIRPARSASEQTPRPPLSTSTARQTTWTTSGLLKPQVEGYRAWSTERGYTPLTVRKMLKDLGQVGLWATAAGLQVTELDEGEAPQPCAWPAA